MALWEVYNDREMGGDALHAQQVHGMCRSGTRICTYGADSYP